MSSSESASRVPAGVRSLRHDAEHAPVLVLVHPAHGDSRAYVPLSDALAPPLRVFGIDAEGLMGEAAPANELDMMITRCVELAGALAGDTRLHLGGASIGGVIAANAAERLESCGQKLGLVFIIDAPAPHEGMRRRPTDAVALAELYVRAALFTAGAELPILKLHEGTPGEVAEFLASRGIPPLLQDIPVARQLALFGASARAYFQHRQQPLSRELLFVESEDEHPQHRKPPSFGWEKVTRNLASASCAGTHFTLLQPPHVRSLAATLDAYFAEA